MAQITTVPAPGITTGNYFFLKGRFKSTAANLYGLFLVVFNPQKVMEVHNAAASSFSTSYDLEPHIEWERYEEKITEYRWKGNCNASMTNSIVNAFEDINRDSRLRDELYSLISSYNYSQLEIMLFDQLNRIVRDRNIIIESGIQEATPEEVIQVRERRSVASKDESAAAPAPETTTHDFEVEEGSTIVPVSMLLSPVRGKLLYELKIGDKIMLRLNAKNEIGKYYIDFFSLRTPDGKIKAIAGEVIDIRSEKRDMPVSVLTKIDERVYGLSTEEERHVRVCIYDPKVDGPLRTSGGKKGSAISAGAPTSQKYSATTYLMIGFIAFIMVTILILIYILL
jgi:hypothetical protein